LLWRCGSYSRGGDGDGDGADRVLGDWRMRRLRNAQRHSGRERRQRQGGQPAP
jgi:hypothetical protein